MRLRSGGFIILCLALALVACGDSDDPLVLTDADSGREFTLESGDSLTIKLDSNPSTGFAWTLDASVLPTAVVVMGTEFEDPATDLVGVPGQEVFLLEAVEPGAGVIRLEYTRDFDEPVIPERVAEFVIRVDDAPWPPDGITVPGTSVDTVDEPGAVADVVADPEARDVFVRGFVVWDSGGARLCEVLMESFPPQCGGSFVAIANPEVMTFAFEDAQGVRWTQDWVDIRGFYDGLALTIDP